MQHLIHSRLAGYVLYRLEDAKTLLNRMGFFDGDDSDDTESITAKLYEEIVHFNWFDPEVSDPRIAKIPLKSSTQKVAICEERTGGDFSPLETWQNGKISSRVPVLMNLSC